MFRPEFLNRIDETIVFDQLTEEETRQIVDIIVAEVSARLAEHGVSIDLTDAARDWLASEGFDRVYGARPLRRVVQRSIENPLSRLILGGEFVVGDHIRADIADEGGLSFEKVDVAEQVLAAV